MANNPLLGNRISLISKRDIRYEGTLYSINEADATVALQNVRSYGTEGREKLSNPQGTYVPPMADQVHPCLVFRGCDIKDLHVHDTVTTKDPPPQQQLPDDPAIVSTVVPPPPDSGTNQTKPQVDKKKEEEQQRQQPQDKSSAAAANNNNDSENKTVNADSNGINGTTTDGPTSANGSSEAGNGETQKPSPEVNTTVHRPDATTAEKSEKSHPSSSQYQQHKNNNTNGTTENGTAADGKRGKPQSQPPYPKNGVNNNNSNNDGSSRGYGGGASSSNGHRNNGGNNNHRNNRRPRGKNGSGNPAPQIGTGASLLLRKERGVVEGAEGPTSGDFDFESSTAGFQKDQSGGGPGGEAGNEGTNGTNSATTTETSSYQKDDFFDTISCDASDRLNGVDNRLRGAAERSLNTETFGAASLGSGRRGGGRRYRRRGGGGGGRGGGRGSGGGGYDNDRSGGGGPPRQNRRWKKGPHYSNRGQANGKFENSSSQRPTARAGGDS